MKTPLRLRILALVSTLAASLIASYAQAAAGDLYTKDLSGPIIRIAPNGTKTTFAAGDGSTTSGMEFDRAGNLYIAARTKILKFAPDGTQTTFAAGLSEIYELAFDQSDNLFVSERDSGSILKFAPNGAKTVFASGLTNPAALAFDGAGNLYVTQASAGPVLKFRPDGTSSVFAPAPTSNNPYSGIAIDGAGNVYISEFVPGTVYKFSPDGATRTVFVPPANSSTGSIEFDSVGNLFVFVEGKQSIYKVTPAGSKTLFASNLGFSSWGAFEPARGSSLNLSTRLRVQTGENVAMAGFIITGSQPANLVVRGIGPSLIQSGVTSALQDPILSLHTDKGTTIATNDNWKDTQQNALQLSGLAPNDDRESAMAVTLNPGAYTAVLQGKNDTTGVGLVEVYDLDRGTKAKLLNISTRGRVETGINVMIGGFIVGENGEDILLRAIGPSLVNMGVIEPLPDPTLSLFNGNGALLASNDNWKDSQEIAIGATGLAPSDDSESSILTTLSPGAYTAVVQDRKGVSGVAVVEIYNLQ